MPARFSMSQMPPRWLILSTTGVVAVCLIAVWWLHGTSAKESNTGSETTAPTTTTVDSKPSPIPEPLPVGPGEIATTSELAKDWSARKFIFRDPLTSREVPAMVVRLPGGVYWGFSLVEPYGSCEMEFVTDMEKLRTDYGFRASHPMVGDPCNRAVFDLTRYGSGPAGLVRGEIAHGAAVRPPMAIEIQVRGKQVLAQKIE
jgi:arsenite oxidase small subunit